ncbi:unnamed protein product [Phytophthora fragariaefolia]|uniref:Unnamed protein product n=1 Tax=Phytophthora fragariaefolia TaxID=1490495 RepID=A0A9W7D5M9_9STRA|nr:unnamed protein product [Phytophthora fragariaefolia]
MALSTTFSALDLRDRFYHSLMRESDIPLTANGVRPDPGKVRVINEWPTPSNAKELRQFLGLATYLCKYVSNYAGKIRPLAQLLKKDAAWDWTAECQKAFDAVTQGLTEAPMLVVTDQDRPFHVVCDASDFAIGCALMQHDHEERDRVVYYQSRHLKPANRNYPVHDKELLAMKYALAKFRVYLLGGRPFVVYTDHASLRTAIKSPHISQRMARWLSFFATYNFQIEYKSGRLNVVADALSRRPDYAVHKADGNAIGVLKLRITYEYHDAPTSGHPGREKTYSLLTRDFYWSHQYKSVRKYVRACEVCQRVKPVPFSQAPLQSLPTPSECWQSISMDFIFGLPPDSKRRTGIVVFVDRFSKMVHLAAVPAEVAAKQTARLFVAWCSDTMAFRLILYLIVIRASQRVSGKKCLHFLDAELNTEFSWKAVDFVQLRQAVIRFVQDAIAASVGRQKLNADNNSRGNTNEFKVGSLVLLATQNLAKHAVSDFGASLLAPLFIGPFTVLAKHGNAYTLDIPSSMRLHPTFYVGQLKPYAQHESPSLGDSAPTPARARRRAFARLPASTQGRPARSTRSARPARSGPSTGPPSAVTRQTQPSGGVQQPPDDQRSLADQTRGVFPPPPPSLRDAQGATRWIIFVFVGKDFLRTTKRGSRGTS